MKKMVFLMAICLLQQIGGWGNSVTLFNNTDTRLSVEILSADGIVLDEMTLNPRDASEWSDDYQQFGYEPSLSQTPYTVNWYCMNGSSFGTCTNVASGAVVLAQSCSTSSCPEVPEEE